MFRIREMFRPWSFFKKHVAVDISRRKLNYEENDMARTDVRGYENS